MRTCAVATEDPELLEQILATAAAAAVEPSVVSTVAALRPHWSSADVVVVGVDTAAGVAAAALPRRPEVFVVGAGADHERLCAWSGPLGATVMVLPESAGWLTASLADTRQQRGRGRLVAVLGGSGGVGASTWAAGLAVTAARQQLRTALVDADPLGGGLDLLMGAERSGGWRWPRLAGARGHLGDLSGQLPSVAGVDLLSVGRDEGADPGPPGVEQLTAVLRSFSRTHDLTVVDLPRPHDWIAREVTRQCDLLIVMVRADVRGVSAARAVLDQVRDGAAPSVLVRVRRLGLLTADAVATGLGRPLLGTVVDDSALRVAAERGEPPARSARSARAANAASCRAALRAVLAEERRVA